MISAIELRNRGLKAIEDELKVENEGVISYKGKPKYVVIPYEKYEKLMALELDLAYKEVMQNIDDGKYKVLKSSEDIEKHINSLKNV